MSTADLGSTDELNSRWRSWWRAACEQRAFYLFISPFFLLFAIFGLYPLFFSLYLSFVHWDGLTEMRWVGGANFAAMWEDEILRSALWNTAVLAALHIPTMLCLAFLFALALNQPWLRWRSAFRAAFFLPCITPMVAIALVFGLVLSSERGLLNYAIVEVVRGVTGTTIEPIPWLTSAMWSKVSLALLSTWRWTGYTMVLMLAGLQGIPAEYYESARLDGANRWQQMWHITLPMMRPVFVFCGIMSLLGTVYMFDEVLVLTKGGPGDSSLNIGLYLFNISFVDFRFGYGSAVGYTVAVVVFAVSLFILRKNRPGAA